MNDPLPPTVDLSNCDREPIHIPGSIQPHGCLIACDTQAAMIRCHSANAPALLQVDGAVNGRHIEEVLGDKATHTLRNALAGVGEALRPALLFDLKLPSGKSCDVSIHRFKSSVIIEFEEAAAGSFPLQLARELINRTADVDDLDRLIPQAARLVRGVLGYDRVMIYRFEQDGAGKVVAEAKRADLESFLGQYFPASDIPRQARALYLRNTIRIISNARGARVPLVPELDASGEPLDLSLAHLRSVSPIHLEYLRNMGVEASMSISVVMDGALWGLIACHHYAPKVLPMSLRVAAEMFGEFFSLHLQALRQKRKLDTANKARQALDRFLQMASHDVDIDGVLRENLPGFMRLMPCDGAGVWMNDRWDGMGALPPPEAIVGLARFIASQADGKIWASHALSQAYPASEDYSGDAAGVLAIPLSQRPKDYLFFFRKEFVQTLNWAGNPDKTYATGPLGDRLTPRRSFAIWKDIVHQQSPPWTQADREIAETARAAIVEIVLRHNELVSEERSRADVRQRMLNEELNHRVKNVLAIIKSLVGHPVREGRSLQDYVQSLKGRIQALSFAHDKVVRGDGGGLLSELLSAELSPYEGQGATIALDGPRVWLDSRAFSVMALMLNELATNAAKYGALSRGHGRLDVSWTTHAGACEIHWRESGGPPVAPPSRTGFGTALIDRSIPFDLGGESEVRYDRDGLEARFLIPAKNVALANGEAMARPAGDMGSPGLAAIGPETSVMLVEDQMLIAMDIEGILQDAGLTDISTTNSTAEALARLKARAPTVAVLDVNLGQDTSIPVAQELKRRGIPFVFATGYGDSSMIPPDLGSVPVVRKPYDGETLLAAIGRVLAG